MKNSVNLQKKLTAKVLTVILATLIAISALAYGVSNTFAATGDVDVVLTAPTGISAANTVEIGSIKNQTVTNLSDAVSGNTSLATVSFTPGSSLNNLRITGVMAGIVSISYGNSDGVLLTTRYQITDSRNISSYKLMDNGEVRFTGASDAPKDIPLVPNEGASSAGIYWSSTNEAVATVHERTGVVTPVGDGASIIVGKFVDKWGRDQDMHVLAIVGKIGGNGGNGGGVAGGTITDETTIANDNGNGGRVLTSEQTGDTVSWIEIARNGDYSLIVRSDFINTNSNHLDDPAWQGVVFGSNNGYAGSRPQTAINDWFNGRSAIENLSADARLRDFTISNNASSVLGTGSSDAGGLSNGFSKPTGYHVGLGNDIAFALSFTEAANFISKSYNVTAGGGDATSSAGAAANFAKLAPYPTYNSNMTLNSLWLRSPGTNPGTATELQHNAGRAFQLNIGTTSNLVYPALWVHSSIFND